MDKRDFLVTAKQMKAIKSGNGIQLSHAQLTNPSKVHRHPISVNMYPEGLKKLNQSMAKNKGFRMMPDKHFTNEYSEYSGGDDDVFEGGFLGIGKAFKKAGKTISKSAKSTGKAISKSAKSTGKAINKIALKSDIGGVVEDLKNQIGEENVTLLMSASLMSAGIPPEQAQIMAASGAGAVYSVDFGKQLKGQGKSALTGAAKAGANEFAKQNDIEFNFDTAPSDGKKFDIKKSITDTLVSSANEKAGKMKSGNGLFDQKKLSAIVAKTKKQIANGGSFQGSGFLDHRKLSSAVTKAQKQIVKAGGSFRGSGYQGGSFRD